MASCGQIGFVVSEVVSGFDEYNGINNFLMVFRRGGLMDWSCGYLDSLPPSVAVS